MRFFLSILSTLLITFSALPATPTYNPQNLIIATDLDDVVLKKKWSGILSVVFKNILHAFPAYKEFKEYKKTTPNADSIRKGGEGFYIYLKNKGNHKPAAKVLEACTQKQLIHGTVKIMQSLADTGYSIYTATNIGPIFFAELQKKFPKVFNDACIKHGMTVDYSQTDIIKKPNPRYFEDLKKKLNPDDDKHILFIDDKLENVEAARAAGLLAIHFKTDKQLQKDLQTAFGICTYAA